MSGINAVGVFAADAAFGHNMGHSFLNSIQFNLVLSLGKTFKVNWHVLVPRCSGKWVAVGGVGELVQ
jgi:hypothetical protein